MNDAQRYLVSSAPHAHSGATVRGIMLDVIIALIPAMLAACYLFGWQAIRLLLVCVIGCVAMEAASRKIMRRNLAIDDLSAVVTGILLALNLPPSLPSSIALIGCFFAIVIAKQVFGGIGYNPFNPALIARVALLASFPTAMTRWHAALNPDRWINLTWVIPDSSTTATPLGIVKTAISLNQSPDLAWNGQTMLNYMLGNMSGCIGEVSAVALLLGGGYMLYRKCISWHIPVFYLLTVTVFAGILRIAEPDTAMPVTFHLLTGGLFIGAIFMATDMTTSPLTRRGQVVYGIGCGMLTMLIRRWGGYPEGVSFAILLMNAVAPLINQITRPGIYGKQPRKARYAKNA